MSRRSKRFYVEQLLPAKGGNFLLSPRETFHLSRVLRLKAGDSCEIFDREGRRAGVVIESVSETGGAKLRVKEIFPLIAPSLFLKVAQALPQRRKMDHLVEKAEELAVQELWVLETKRNIVKMGAEACERARARWERILVEAAKQSGSPVFTKIVGPIAFEQVVKERLEPADRAFIFHTDSRGLAFREFVEILRGSHEQLPRNPAFLFFGPEGGFTEEEVGLAESRGVKKVYLGDTVLRLETAFLGVLSALRFLLL